MNVLYISSDRGGCRHYRCLLPAQELSRAGHKVLVGADLIALPSGEIAGRHPQEHGKGMGGFDVVVLQRWMHERAAQIIGRARALGQAVINDVDDWFFGIPTSNAGFAATHASTDATHNVDHYRKALAASSAITVSTPYLAERLGHLGRPVYVLRNLIDLHRWRPRGPGAGVPRRVGWLGHTSYRASGDLRVLSGVIGPWLARHPDWRFLHLGSYDDANAEAVRGILGLAPEQFEALPPCGIEDLPAAYARFDLGLAPLEDCPFNRSKSWLKPLEYAAAGVASIASELPEYEAFACCATAARPREWRDLLDSFDDADTLRAAAAIARARAEQLDIARGWVAWEAVYQEVANRTLGAAVLEAPASAGKIVPASSFRRARRAKR